MTNKRNDWLSSKKEDQLAMVLHWLEYGGENCEAWNIPQAAFTKLNAAYLAAKNANSVPAGMRNAMTNATLKTAFAELTAQMRDMKKRYFYEPPLTATDFAALGLRMKDSLPTTVAKPLGQAEADVEYLGAGVLQLRIRHVEGTPADAKADYGYKIHYGVYADSDTLPANGRDFSRNKFSRRKKVVFEFAPADAKKTAYFCIKPPMKNPKKTEIKSSSTKDRKQTYTQIFI
jgi:hypothetical protein